MNWVLVTATTGGTATASRSAPESTLVVTEGLTAALNGDTGHLVVVTPGRR